MYCDSLAFQVGIHVVSVKRLPSICAIHVHIPCARAALRKLDYYVSEETKASVKLA